MRRQVIPPRLAARSLPAAFALCALLCGALSQARGSALEPAKAAGLEVSPGLDGSLTVVLVAPPVKGEVSAIKQPPPAPREGQPGPGGGVWSLHVSELPHLDFRRELEGSGGGVVWCAARARSLTGGPRTLTVISLCAVKVFLDGKLILDKPGTEGFQPDRLVVQCDMPKGEAQLLLAVSSRYGYCALRAALVDPAALRPAAGDAWVLPLAAGKPPDPGGTLAEMLALLPDTYFVAGDQKVEVLAQLRGGWPLGIGAVTPRFTVAGGQVLPGEFPARAPDQLAVQPWKTTLTVPADAPARVELKCELLAGGKVVGAKTVALCSPVGVLKEAGALQRKIALVRHETHRATPCASLALEQIALWLEELSANAKAPSQTHAQTLLDLLERARTCLAVEAAGGDPLAGKTGYLERTYQSAIDDSPQPYFVMVPSAARDAGAEKKKFPLVLFLHGYVPGYHKHLWWTAFPEFNAQFEEHGAFLAIPFGRSNADFLGAGEVDVLDVLKEMKRLYPIDEDRIYLYGYSMGGMAVYSLGGHYPGPWAAGIVLAGRADSPLLMHTGGLATLHPFKQFLVRTDQPIDLCENFVNVPLRIWHGKMDQFIDVREAEQMLKRLKEVGCDAELKIVEGGDHFSLFDVMAAPDALNWLLAQKRSPKSALRWLKNYIPRFGAWERPGPHSVEFSVEHVTGDLAVFEAKWRWQEPERFVIEALAGPVASAKSAAPPNTVYVLPEAVRGAYAQGGIASGAVSFLYLTRPAWAHPPGTRNPEWKTPLRCGPVKEATYSSFMIVVGTTGGPESAGRLQKQAADFAQEWYDFAKGQPRLKADKDVTAEDQQNYNLFLLGEEQENSVHAAAAKTGKLPFTVKDGQAQVGEKKFALADHGIVYIYPNPLAGAGADRSLVVVAGLPYGKRLPSNHKLDLIPDFLVFNGEADSDGTNTDRPVAAGFFDGKWKLNPATTWFFEEKPAVKPPAPPAPPSPGN